VLAETRDVDDLLDAVRAGAIGYVPGGLNGARLRRIIRAASDHQAIVPRALVRELILDLRRAGTRDERLTVREGQVLRLLRGGYTTAAIAERLEIAPVTVRRHVSDIVHKLGVDNRAALSSHTTS
jgi:DNA-binding NarL/FixJ family response regulator